MIQIIPSGIPGFDRVLNGGLIKGCSYLVKGGPGSGKTIFGLQFLLEGIKNGEKSAFISFEESEKEVQMQAKSFGWDIDDVVFIDLTKEFDILSSNFLFLDSDNLSEINSFIQTIAEKEELKGVERLFVDGCSVLRDIINNDALFRRIFSSIVNFLSEKEITALVSDEMMLDIGREAISYLTSGEFVLECHERRDREILRTINIVKYRSGSAYIGRHYFEITDRGIVVYPIIPNSFDVKPRERFSTGNPDLDSLIGPLYTNSTIMITGKSGVGKTNTSLQFLLENDRKGCVGILYTFEEDEEEIKRRYKDIFDYTPKKIVIRRLSPYSLNIGMFYNIVEEDVSFLKPSMIVIDSINLLEKTVLMGEELERVLHFIQVLLRSNGVTLILIHELLESVDIFQYSGGLSHFADYVILGRHVEMKGKLLKAIYTIKNRFGDHERSARIIDFRKGLEIGRPLEEYSGIISGYYRK